MRYTSKYFDYTKDFTTINFRKHPELYQVGRGEQGVLLVEPYKSEILPFWKFKTPEIAEKSAKKIYSLFLAYKVNKDFVGMDMARKFLQMGYTRSRRYANHSSGKKYSENPQKIGNTLKEQSIKKNPLPQEKDWQTNDKAVAARIFYEYYKKVTTDNKYLQAKKTHQNSFG